MALATGTRVGPYEVFAQWGRDGREAFYTAEGNGLVTVPLTWNSEAVEARKLFDFTQPRGSRYAASPTASNSS